MPLAAGKLNAQTLDSINTGTATSGPPPKLPPLPPNKILQKRPLLHPPIPNNRSKRTQQVVYVSAKTPFISAVKRVRKILAAQEGPYTGGLDEISAEQGRRVQGYRQQQQQQRRGQFGGNRRGGGGGAAAAAPKKVSGPESVVLKATGRAIEKCMSLGAYFLKDSSVKVTIATGSVDVVDDIVRNPAAAPTRGTGKKGQGATGKAETKKIEMIDAGVAKVNNKKRKSADIEDQQDGTTNPPQDGQSTEKPHDMTDSARAGKRPRLDPNSEDAKAIPPPPPIIHPNTNDPMITENPLPNTITNAENTSPPDHAMEDAEEEDEDEDEDDDGSDGEIMRRRKTSVLEITITLLRH